MVMSCTCFWQGIPPILSLIWRIWQSSNRKHFQRCYDAMLSQDSNLSPLQRRADALRVKSRSRHQVIHFNIYRKVILYYLKFSQKCTKIAQWLLMERIEVIGKIFWLNIMLLNYLMRSLYIGILCNVLDFVFCLYSVEKLLYNW